MEKMKVLAIIPARGGSKAIPRKNVQLVAGKPLIGYTIEQACQTPSINRVVVSTDDAEIRAVSQQFGAEVVQRPMEISGDSSSSESALFHVLNHLRDVEAYEPDLVVFLQATSPIRQPDDIENALQLLISEEADSLLSAFAVHGFMWRIQNEQLSSFSYDYQTRPMRQDAPDDLMENGSIYIFKPWVLHQTDNRLGGKITIYLMDTLDSFQVDEPADLTLIEHLLPLRL